MKPISEEIVESTQQKIAEYSMEQGQQLAAQFGAEQPAIMNYLMTADEALLDQDERELLFYTGAVIWQIMAQGDQPLPTITDQAIQSAANANARLLDPIAGLTDADRVIVVRTLLQYYKQPALLKYIVRTLTNAVQSDEVRADNMGIIMFDLKTVIDCLDSGVETES